MSSQLLFMPAVLLDLLSRAGAVGGFSTIQKQEKGQTGLLLSLTVSMLRRYLCPRGSGKTAVAGFALL